MKFIIKAVFAISLLSVKLYAQYFAVQIKENFDYLSAYNKLYSWDYLYVEKNLNHPFNNFLIPIDSTLNDRLGEKYGHILRGLIHMYETTQDKAYLIKFVALTYHIQVNLRQDNGLEPYPGWREYLNQDEPNNEDKVEFKQMYQDGRVLAPMARYVYILSQHPTLAATPLPPLNKLGSTFDALIYPASNSVIGGNAYTYGGYANWLATRVMQSLLYFELNHWADNMRCYVPKPLYKDFNQRAQILNQQVSFGEALLYLGLATNNTSLLYKAAIMGLRYKSSIIDLQSCKYNPLKFKYTPNKHYVRPVLEYVPASNAYRWKSNGWRPQDCKELYGTEPDDYEDFGHAAHSVSLPYAMNNKLSVNGQLIFDNTHMVRFRNAVSKYVYGGYANNGCPFIHAGIDGDDIITYRIEYNGMNNPKTFYNALAWSRFSKFDGYPTTGNSESLYNIMFKVYNCGIANVTVPPEEFIGLPYYGLSMLINEQWNRECVNLSLYKRNMVYNQDFFVKNKIWVCPADTTEVYNSANSYAEPKIAAKEFTIEPGVTVNMLAGEEIRLSDGFHAKAGSNFHAGIVPNACTDGQRLAAGSGTEPITAIDIDIPESLLLIDDKEEEAAENYFSDITVFPNPTNGILNIVSEEHLQANDVSLYDMFGKHLPVQVYGSGTILQIDLSIYSKGLYLLRIGAFTQRLVLE